MTTARKMMKTTKHIQKNDIINDIIRIKEKLGTTPSYDQYEEIGTYSVYTVCWKFKTWNNALRCIFGCVNLKSGTRHPKQDVTCVQCDRHFVKLQSQINLYPLNFCSKSCAAKYNNTHKTKGMTVSKLEVYVQEQLVVLYPSLEFHFNRKGTVNSELDIYIPSLKLAFELNGIFHYKPIFGQEKLINTQNNDHKKLQACAKKGISLCVINASHMEKFNQNQAQKYLDVIISVINTNGNQCVLPLG